MAHQATPFGQTLRRESSLPRYLLVRRFQNASLAKKAAMPLQRLQQPVHPEEAEPEILQTSRLPVATESVE